MLLVVPLHHLFGSEELSVLSPGIAERSPSPYLGLCHADADRFGLEEGAKALLTFEGGEELFFVRFIAGLPRGVAGLPSGLPGLPYLPLPAWYPVRRLDDGR
jgi:NADH-quinone oxidoreductase subunit G